MSESLQQLEQRRQELGMAIESLAKLSGVSLATTKRILRGAPGARWDNVLAIAEALQMRVQVAPVASAAQAIEGRALEKADRAVRLTQATSALEAQGVSPQALKKMRGQAKLQLLQGSRRALWK